MENNTGKKEVIMKIKFDYFLNVGYEATTVRMVCKRN
jgi:AcrR family transcriptional regulator